MNKGKEKFKFHSKTVVFTLAAIFALGLISVGYALNFSFSDLKNFSLTPVKEVKAQTTALYQTNIHVSALTSTAATLAWETNLLSDSRVKIGKTASYEMTCGTCYSDSRVKTHRIAIGGLTAGTTYHFQVISKTESGEEKASLDRTFVTPQPSNDTVAPSVTKLQVEAWQTQAVVSVTTTEEAHVIVAYADSSQLNFDATPNKVDDIALPFQVDHRITLNGLTSPTTYFYRVRVLDQSNNSLTSGEFTFDTTGGIDHVLSTGQCGTVAVGECASDGYYCEVGTATLVSNCLHCGYRCPGGQSCQVGGVCTNDPSLSGDPYQCNRADCYRSCSDDDSISCASDQECLAAGAGICVDDGAFNNPALSGCFGTYPRCDANTILKVKKDRECAKWLTCGTAIEQVDPKTNQSEELCFDLAACTALGQGNQCSSYAILPRQELTYRSPEEIDQIKWLSGSVSAGLDWQYQENSPVIKGSYPWSAMEEIGGKLKIDNYNFEETKMGQALYDMNGDTLVDSKDKSPTYDIKYWHNFTKYPNLESNLVVIDTDWDPATVNQKDNRVLKIVGMNAPGQGVAVKISQGTNLASRYVLNLRIKSNDPKTQKIKFDLSNGVSSSVPRSFGEYALNTGWQKIITPAIFGVGGGETYLYIYVSNDASQMFYIDDIEIKPVLEIQDGVYLTRSCRLYPKEDSPACEYTDDNGISQKGWYGYCLQRDPKNESLCLSWWPVDILLGESNLFGEEQTAGYTGRAPLYYCLESAGSSLTGLRIDNKAFCASLPEDGCLDAVYDAINDSDYDVAICQRDNSDVCGGRSFPVDQKRIAGVRMAYRPLVSGNWSWHLNENEIVKVKADDTWNYDGGGYPQWPVSFEFKGENMIGEYNYEPDPTTVSNGINDERWARMLNSSTPSEIIWFYQNNFSFAPADNGWSYVRFALVFECLNNDGTAKACDLNNDRGFLKGVGIWGSDKYGVDIQGVGYRILIAHAERCNKIVQVAKETGQSAAWADNIQSSALKISDLNYKIDTDLNPFGGAVTAEGEPSDWLSPLVVEEPNTSILSSPYQTRAGKPYACVGDCSKRICWGGGNKDGHYCRSELDCAGETISGGVSVPVQGVCIGVGTLSNTATPCTADSASDICLGGAASNRGEQLVYDKIGVCSFPLFKCNTDADCPIGFGPCNLPAGNSLFAQSRLRSLFAQSYGLWKWNLNTSKYDYYDFSWEPPTAKCSDDNKRPVYGPTELDTYCGYAPTVRNIKLGDGASNMVQLGTDGGRVKLSFNTAADSQQQPLKSIWIDWGDKIIPYPFQYKSKDDPNNPHVFTHAYSGCTTGSSCRYNIKILVEDNWGWCSAQPEGRNPDRSCEAISLEKLKPRWDPVNTNACSGGTCSNGACAGGADNGRPCGELIVELKD